MADWKQDLGKFFKDKGINDKAHEFTGAEIQEIQKFINEKVKPAYEKISKELNQYASVKAVIAYKTGSGESIQENLFLRVEWIMQPKFYYRGRLCQSCRGADCHRAVFGT